jgi:hypothetical protein
MTSYIAFRVIFFGFIIIAALYLTFGGDERGTNDIPFNADQYYSQTFGN